MAVEKEAIRKENSYHVLTVGTFSGRTVLGKRHMGFEIFEFKLLKALHAHEPNGCLQPHLKLLK